MIKKNRALIYIMLLIILFAGCKAEPEVTINSTNNVFYDYVGVANEGLIPVKIDRVGGYINYQQEIIIPLKFQEVLAFSEGIAAVKQNNKYGCINQKGEIVIPFEYDFISYFKNGVAPAKIDGKYFLINSDGKKIIEDSYEFIYSEIIIEPVGKNEIPKISKEHNKKEYRINEMTHDLFLVKQNDKWGYINSKGEVIIDVKYDNIYELDSKYFVVSEGEAYGCVDLKNNTIIPTNCFGITYLSNDKFLIIRDNICYIINNKNEILLSGNPNEYYKFIGGEYIEINNLNNVTTKIYNMKENISFVPLNSYKIEAANGNYVLASSKNDDKKGLLNQKGMLPLKFKYDNIYFYDKQIVAQKGDKCILYTLQLEKVKTYNYKNLVPVNDNNEIYIAFDGSYYGMIDKEGNKLTEFASKEINDIGDGIYLLERGKKYRIFKI